MGKIMLNGTQYGIGGIEQAKDISYDNTESGATATDVQGALDELNAGLNDVFSYDERKVGTWVDGKPLYRKVILLSSLPNATSTTYQHGIQNVETIFVDGGHSFAEWSSGSTAQLPYLSNAYSSAVDINAVTDVSYVVNTHGTDRRTMKAYITFLYTKTTD